MSEKEKGDEDVTDHPASPLPERGSCTGCGACASGCPKGAIHMLPDREGFLYPTVTDACIQCGHCAHICPVRKQREPRPEPAVFAAWNPDAAVRQASTAGGVFSLLAEYILDEGGVVFGAALDEELQVRHIAVKDKAELPRIRGQSRCRATWATASAGCGTIWTRGGGCCFPAPLVRWTDFTTSWGSTRSGC